MTIEDLLRVVYQFYPRGIWTTSPGYKDTPEYRRRVEATRRAVAEYPKWKAMLGRLRARYGIHDCSLHILGGSVDSAYTVKLEIPAHEAEDRALDREYGFQVRFGCSVSYLGPYYVVRHRGVLREDPYVRDVAQEVEASYGYTPIPPAMGRTVVPDVALDTLHPGEVTIADCLLSDAWGR